MRYVVALALVWLWPAVSVCVLWLGVNGFDALIGWGWVGTALGVPVAVLLTLVVLPAMVLADASTAWDRHRTDSTD